jgi:hypothetical protein
MHAVTRRAAGLVTGRRADGGITRRSAGAGRRAWLVPVLAVAAGALLAVPLAGAAHAATTWIVTDCSDSVSDTGSLPYAVANAQSGDTITFDTGSDVGGCAFIGLDSPLTIAENLTITAAGMEVFGLGGVFDITQAGAVVDISGLDIEYGGVANANSGVTNSGGIVSLIDSTVSDNNAPGVAGAGISNYGDGSVTLTDSTVSGNRAGVGGGIYNDGGSVTLTDSTVSGNTAPSYGGGILGGVTLTDSTVSDNTATNGGGGGIWGDGSRVTLTDSTVSGNTATSYGGGINTGGGSVTLTDSTVSGNTAFGGGAGISSYGGGAVTVGATIVAGNTGGNCSSPLTSVGYNLSDDASCGFTAAGDLANTNPLLGPLGSNGGPTQTMVPGTGSPAIGAIPPGTTLNGVPVCPRTDQRGVASADGGVCTIGAVEVPTFAITVEVSGSQVYGSTPSFTETNNAPGSATVNDANLACTTADGGTALSALSATGSPYTLDGSSCSGVTATGPVNYQINYQGVANGFTVTKISQTVTFTSTPPASPVVGGSYEVAATGGGSGNQVLFLVDSSTTNNACSLKPDGVTVSFNHAGTCVIDATQAGNQAYAAGSASQTISVGPATPTITWQPNPATVTWGTPLSAAQLGATATVGGTTVPGTFTYTQGPSVVQDGTVLGPGTSQALKVTFTPTDTADYTDATATASVNVAFNPAACITGKVTGGLVIGTGQAYCVQAGATITGGVTVQAGGALYMTGGTIKGGLTATGAAAITVCGASLSGGLTITGATGPLAIGSCGNNTISGAVSITSNAGGVTYQNNAVSGSVTITGNTGGFGTLAGNTTTGKVTITNNT